MMLVAAIAAISANCTRARSSGQAESSQASAKKRPINQDGEIPGYLVETKNGLANMLVPTNVATPDRFQIGIETTRAAHAWVLSDTLAEPAAITLRGNDGDQGAGETRQRIFAMNRDMATCQHVVVTVESPNRKLYLTDDAFTLTENSDDFRAATFAMALSDATIDLVCVDDLTAIPSTFSRASPPDNPSGVRVNRGSGQATVSWTASTTPGARYAVSYKPGGAPATCAEWYVEPSAVVATSTSITISGLDDTQSYGFRVCSVTDGAPQSKGVAIEVGIACPNPQWPTEVTLTEFAPSTPAIRLAGDFDQDGDIDFVAEHYGSMKLALYRNDGQANFAEEILVASSFRNGGGIAADVNGDGYLDLLFTSLGSSTIHSLVNDGNGNFTSSTIGSTGFENLTFLDFDGDGHKDVFATTRSVNAGEPAHDKTVTAWFAGNGSGQFGNRQDLREQSVLRNITVDFNQDGILDLVFSTNYTDGENGETNMEVELYSGSSNGYIRSTIYSEADVPDVIAIFGAADVDADGDIDLLARPTNGTLEIYLLRNQNGNLVRETIHSGDDAAYIGFRDLDYDGDPDIFAATFYPNQRKLYWLENDGTGIFTSHVIDSRATRFYIVAPELHDLNGDGLIDFLFADQAENRFKYRLQTCD